MKLLIIISYRTPLCSAGFITLAQVWQTTPCADWFWMQMLLLGALWSLIMGYKFLLGIICCIGNTVKTLLLLVVPYSSLVTMWVHAGRRVFAFVETGKDQGVADAECL